MGSRRLCGWRRWRRAANGESRWPRLHRRFCAPAEEIKLHGAVALARVSPASGAGFSNALAGLRSGSTESREWCWCARVGDKRPSRVRRKWNPGRTFRCRRYWGPFRWRSWGTRFHGRTKAVRASVSGFREGRSWRRRRSEGFNGKYRTFAIAQISHVTFPAGGSSV